MAFCIHIKKISQIEDMHIYHVLTTDFGGHDFYISIDAHKKYITYYADKALTQVIAYFDASHDDNRPSFFNIDSRIAAMVTIKCAVALVNNSFPESIGHYA